MNDTITCPTCSDDVLDPWQLCQHRSPICLRCCLGGEHDWPEPNREEDVA